ncbi:MAG: bifunctional folylpolyglutamate synthase/dihydrofolate synthase [Flavobacteriales bacterium]|nr:bifunctional folylpolyglutamate synthase/dihydrofolate synthase [Flavobacteriales bacterium]
MNYKESIDWILKQLPSYHEKGKEAYKPGLDRISNFLEFINSPHKNLKFIHIGGTNGKGSTAHYISSILQESGYKVGLFTSPHFYDFRERIKVNKKKIDKDFITEFTNLNKKNIENNSLSFFELSFGLAVSYFNRNKVDIAIIEVGLGGRLDATNIINPLMSIITNISLDHTEILGDNLEDIAGEKSGIIKKDSITIIGESNNLINTVFINKAKKCNSKIFINDQHENLYSNVLYQEKNISTAIFSIKHLVGFNITEVNILNGIENVELNTGFYGRWSKISDDPKVIIDVAHNNSGFEQLAYQIEREDYKKLYIILGFIKGKKVKELIKYLPIDANLYYTSPKIARGMKKEELLKNIGKTFNFDVNPRSQFLKVKNIASKDDLIIITGSNFLIKDILNE